MEYTHTGTQKKEIPNLERERAREGKKLTTTRTKNPRTGSCGSGDTLLNVVLNPLIITSLCDAVQF